jgi:formate hydrogenlyase transcriptional activator
MSLHPGPKHRQLLALSPSQLEPIHRSLYDDADWYRDLVEHSQDLLWVHDLEGRLLSVNPSPARLLGYTVEELLRIPMREVVAPEKRSEFDAYLKQIAVVGEAEGQVIVLTRAGERRIWEFHNTLRTKGVPEPIVRGMARDITERKEAEKIAQQAREDLQTRVREGEKTIRELKLFRALVEQSNDAIELVDPDTLRFIEVNEKCCSALGYSREEMLNLRVFDIDPAITESTAGPLREQLMKQGYLTLEGVHRRKDGSIYPVEISMRRVELDRSYVIAIVHDLSERKQVEEQLRASELRYRSLHDSSPVGVCWVDTATGRFRGVNRKFCEIAGRSEQDLLQRNFQSITHPDDLPDNLQRLKRMIDEGGRHYEMEKRYVRPDGSIRWVETEIVAMWPEGASPDWHMCIAQDITDRKRTEEALRQSEERFRIALSGSPIKVFNQDRDLRYTWVYNIQEGWSESDYLGKTDTDIFGPETGAHMEAMKRPVLETGQGTRREFALETHGKTYHCDITIEPLRDAAGKVVGINCACVDITQMREITEELRRAKEKLAEEKLYLEEAIDTELGFGEIIGRSQVLKDIMEKVAKVAPSDATVLLLGETGTGKELVARALHHRSKRQGKSFIKMNCAAIPSGLLESELFGHEKGAFTGAIARKLGRLELADGGTLFLDEIGEIPLSLQPKLLRVLQDMEFERLGGTQTRKVNFRLLAATNRDLAQSVQAREFRSDLYYRLNVFPIVIPPLRDRRGDVRPLVEHFVRKFSAQMKKPITSIPSKTMEALVRWDWPGNIRELENFVERSVILTPGSMLQAPLFELEPEDNRGEKILTFHEKERKEILRVLHECRGRLGGPDGAAARLGLKRTTLQSKLAQFGIRPADYRK